MAILRGSASSTGRREGLPAHAKVRDPRAAASRQQRDPPERRPLPFILIETIPLMRANLEKGRSRPYRVQSSFGGAWRSSPRAFRTPWYRVADVSNQASNRQRKAHPRQSFGSRHKRFAASARGAGVPLPSSSTKLPFSYQIYGDHLNGGADVRRKDPSKSCYAC